MKLTTLYRTTLGFISLAIFSHTAYSAVSMDRTRIIFNGGQKSISLNISNNNNQLPYLAQGWLENTDGQKIQSPLVVLPPVQRLEPGKSSQVKIEALPAINTLPQDRESLFYFNLREIPPKTNKPNSLQIALQTRVKLFYRPKAIIPEQNSTPWQEKLTLDKQGERFVVKNPTPYYMAIVNVKNNGKNIVLSNKVMKDVSQIKPFSDVNLGKKVNGNISVDAINDWGGVQSYEIH